MRQTILTTSLLLILFYLVFSIKSEAINRVKTRNKHIQEINDKWINEYLIPTNNK